MYFNPAIGALRAQYPAEAAAYETAYAIGGDAALVERVYLINPLNSIATSERSAQAKHYRIRVGASDAGTSLSVAITLAIKLANGGYPMDSLVWDQPHSEADDPGEVLDWIDGICLEGKSKRDFG